MKLFTIIGKEKYYLGLKFLNNDGHQYTTCVLSDLESSCDLELEFADTNEPSNVIRLILTSRDQLHPDFKYIKIYLLLYDHRLLLSLQSQTNRFLGKLASDEINPTDIARGTNIVLGEDGCVYFDHIVRMQINDQRVYVQKMYIEEVILM